MAVFFSIIIPCYNQAQYLPDCLDSLLNQSFPDWEAIVVNDGSTDATKEVAQSYQFKDSRIRLVEKSNGGLSSARNCGIKSANGSRFIFLDADDYMYSNCLLTISKELKTVSDNTLVQYGYTYITENKESILHTVLPSQQNELIPNIFSTVLGPCHTICISRQLCEAVGLFDETLKSLEDWDFWLRVAKVGGVQKALSIPLVYYRYVRNSMSRNAFVMYESFKKVALRAPKKDARITIYNSLNRDYDFDTNPVLQASLIRCLGVSIMQGKIEQSIELFKKETTKSIYSYRPKEFETMCSYLSFRYWYSSSDIQTVFKSIYPQFEMFFKKLGYDNRFIKEALFCIFKRHMFYRNNYKYGKVIGSSMNYFLRKKYNQ